jgi:ribokinase
LPITGGNVTSLANLNAGINAHKPTSIRVSLPACEHRQNSGIVIFRRNALSAQKPIVVVGSINTDLVAVTQRRPAVGETVIGSDFQIHPGGKGANQAVAVARLGYPVRLIGRLGSDTFGAELRTHLEKAGVDITGVSTTDGASGVAVIVVSGQGENSIVLAPGVNAKVTPEDLDANISILRSAGMVLAQLEIPLETIEYLARICARENVPLILDPAPARDLPPGIFKDIAWFTPNQTEAAFYLGNRPPESNPKAPADMAKMFLSNGCRGVALKMGTHGTYLASQDGMSGVVPAFSVHAIDTTAAGDAFNSGFATALMLGRSPLESAVFAAAVAAISVTRMGAQPSMPSMVEVEEFLKNASHSRACTTVVCPA